MDRKHVRMYIRVAASLSGDPLTFLANVVDVLAHDTSASIMVLAGMGIRLDPVPANMRWQLADKSDRTYWSDFQVSRRLGADLNDVLLNWQNYLARMEGVESASIIKLT